MSDQPVEVRSIEGLGDDLVEINGVPGSLEFPSKTQLPATFVVDHVVDDPENVRR
jgi:hypothetical protein